MNKIKRNKYLAEYRSANRDKIARQQAEYYHEHKTELAKYKSEYYQANKERLSKLNAKYRITHRDEISAYAHTHRIETNKRERKRRQGDVNYKLAGYLRSRFYNAVKRGQKSGSAVKDLGCSIEAFRLFIENQFDGGMSWGNYGEWHLDHVLPLASFDLTDRQQFLEACNWLNYQPMWAKDNRIKGARL